MNLKTLAKYAGVFLLIVLLSFFLMRNFLLNKALEKISEKFSKNYHCAFHVESTSFKGISGVELKNVSIIPESKDTLASIGKLSCKVRILQALLFRFRIKELFVENGFVNLVKKENVRNFETFLHRVKTDSTDETSEMKASTVNYAESGYKLFSKIFAQIPEEVSVENIEVRIRDEDRNELFNLVKLEWHDRNFIAETKVSSKLFSQRWNISGTAASKDRSAKLIFYNPEGGDIRIPYIDERFHVVTGFDSVELKLEKMELNNGELEIKGVASVSDLFINHSKISGKDVRIGQLKFDYDFRIGENYFSLDSNSSVSLQRIHFHPFFKFQSQPDTVYSASIKIEKTKAQDFLDDLPEGLFSHLKGMEATGNFTYSLDFEYNVNHPDNVKFEVILKKENLKINKFGEANLGKLNEDFVYVPYEKGKPMRPINVSAENPYYTSLEKISPFLQKCVLTSEDPSFFQHRGFIEEAFRQSIVKDIQTRKFARGASTISMQLVKNVFLTREKTLSRKMEEILLVYILENNRLVSKERMFEVYLNIIEWGPDVYGIGEASQFYFKKKPSALTLNECLFLSSIIPRPKGFMWRFDKAGNERDFSLEQKTFLSNVMLRRNLIFPTDTFGLGHPVKIAGPAKSFIFKSGLIPADTLLKTEEDVF
ncbi:MAG: transglycosylase domain-containing protein [Bacteroidia bacterium]